MNRVTERVACPACRGGGHRGTVCPACTGMGDERCETCGGQGRYASLWQPAAVPCAACGGSGYRPCRACAGSGSVQRECPLCAGTGRVTDSEAATVAAAPAGVRGSEAPERVREAAIWRCTTDPGPVSPSERSLARLLGFPDDADG